MNLTDALAAVAPVVGDGKLVSQHAYVYSQRRILHATDGRQWAKVDLDGNAGAAEFCVRHEALKRALEREYTSLRSDGDNGLIVSYGRGRARLRGIDPATFPMVDPAPVQGDWLMPPEVAGRVKDLMAFAGGTDGHIWQHAVHFMPNFLFAANSFALCKCPIEEWGWDLTVSLPMWAAKFIANMPAEQIQFRDRGNMISFYCRGVELFSTLLTEEPPENIISFASNLSAPMAAVPDGLMEAAKRIDAHGGKTCKIGEGKVTHASEAIELEDDLALDGPVKTWGIETLLPALEHATTLDLSGGNATWAGSGYVGVFGGRSD